jgi:hypothetical protein
MHPMLIKSSKMKKKFNLEISVSKPYIHLVILKNLLVSYLLINQAKNIVSILVIHFSLVKLEDQI